MCIYYIFFCFLQATVVKASTQHFPELIAEHPELKLEDYQACIYDEIGFYF